MTAPHRTLTLRPGERQELRLPTLSAAGYTWTWQLQGDAEAVEVVQGRPPAEELAGRPFGTSADTLFTLAGVRPGRARLHLAHRRVWERDKPPLEQRSYDITVQPTP
ncbi:protease inhibitor I42 family protein [Streptomyces sp. NA02950]|uniref:protease inhibitor I42 family protein n=1 Tax=Streptomyces sp. NA02950 TaxID=2742137 RepID=UPI0015901811|nr:protease inhibitor I42 family protein [Streptomyces sp. NA02950]QKV95168.1 protease inhibitor I42 family protein [Streptomyces sp. NA02950]